MPASRTVRALLQRIDRCNCDCIAATGDVDASKVAKLIEDALEDPRHHHAIILGLAAYIADAIAGVLPDITL